ncbi:redoxin domain-containing protein [Mesobacillus selenatarsenatis]|uniref:Thioldisulfide oxidoreductase related to ResA n=1 Tax=Mesobacillus selenatarsenatis (strain DSM 18680 / JCM 14380 / FERM P-15431 / SF-1) TaxID=1321606 RepID=A0A0A8X167_MESS1|nr:redoxin domain-containing protein [Mesobacillus selenatarsenatis]GAM12964.1 thioldisulfide oxidoreductase related to ResA [Mesobacillus selenatarsenatis SF-1]
MNKNLLSFAILALAVVILVVNIWKPGSTESEKNTTTAPAGESVDTTEDIPGAKLSSLREGAEAPDFELNTLDGNTIKLSDYRGKKVILNFWATWCPPCKAEMPHMQNFYEEYNDQGVEILAVNLTNMDKGEDEVKKFVEEYGLTFTIPMDEDGNAGTTYQAFTIPTSYILDENGVITKKIVGPMDEKMMKELTGVK